LKALVDDRTKELSKSNKWHEALFENATDGIVVLDRNGIIVNANERACEMHGFSKEALIGSHSSLLEVDENRSAAAERLQQQLRGESLVYETVHYKKDGSRISLEVSSRAIPSMMTCSSSRSSGKLPRRRRSRSTSSRRRRWTPSACWPGDRP